MASSPSSPLSPLVSIVPADSTNELKITDLVDLLQLLRRHGYSGVSYYRFGLYLGLSTNTLDVIKKNNRDDVEECLRECLTKWLQKADDVEKTKGGPSIYSLVSALRELGENGVADGIDMEIHPACRILARYTSNQSLLSALPQLGILLYLEKLTRGMILPTNQQGEALLIDIKEAVCLDCQKLKALGKILCKLEATAEIGSTMMHEYIGKNYWSDDSNDEGIQIKLSESVTKEFETMRLKFAQIFFDVGSVMKSNPEIPSLDNIKCVLRIYDEALRPQVSQCQDIRDILELVSDNSSLDDIRMLEFFVNKFNIEEAKPVIEEYKEAIEEFKNTKLSKFLNEQFSRASPLKCERITIVVDKDVNKAILRDVRRLSVAIFENLSQHVRLNVIREGNSFTITCSFALILSEQLISVAQNNIDVLKENKVKRLTIGYCTVYEVHKIDDTSAPATIESDEQQFSLSSPNSSGLLKQLMISLSVQIINSEEDLTYEDSIALMKEAESLKEVLDTKIKMLSDGIAESDEFKEEFEKLKELKEIFENQLELFKLELKNQAQADDIQRFFATLNHNLPRIAVAFDSSVTETKGLVTEATDGLKEVREHKKVREVREVKESYKSLENAMEAVHTYLDKVNGLYQTLKDQPQEEVVEDIESREMESTEQLTDKINKILQDSTDQYAMLLKCFEEFATNCNDAQRELTRLKEEAESSQRRAAYAAGGTAVGGVAASVLVGLFTFGIGAAVGIPLALSLGGTAAATTLLVVLAIAYGNTAERFGKMNERIERLKQFKEIQNMIDELNGLTTKNIAKVRRMTLSQRTDFAMKMKSTLEQSMELFNKTSFGLKTAEQIKIDFTNKVEEAFSAN